MSLVLVRPPGRARGPVPVGDAEAQERALREVVERHRGKLEVLADGSVVAIITNADAATDLASRAARCALAIQRVLRDRAVVVVTGREVLGPSLPRSELLDRAMAVLAAADRRGPGAGSEGGSAGAAGENSPRGIDRAAIRIDELTAALLGNRFDTGATGRHLRGERRHPTRMRLMFGEPPACAGREVEIEQLEAIFNQCAEEHVASMVLLSGPDGVGKSRLGHEFLRRLEARGQPVQVCLGEADALDAGSTFGLLAQILRGALDLRDDEPVEARRDKIRAWVARRASGVGTRLAEVLGDLVGTPFERDDQRELATAPQDARLPSEQMAQAFVSFLRAECATQPVVIVLEDLHWGDLPTIKVIYAALGALSDQPLMVLALARTNVHELFPQLWADRCVQEIRLRKLPRRASAQLVRQMLGDAVADETLNAVVERSGRHASYLEGLIRAVADRTGDATPQSVLAMVQARIEKLDPAARRVLRAASVFGDTFWRGGVEALLGEYNTAAWLEVLVDQGVVEVADDPRFSAEVELRFHEPLVREAVYEMLTQDERVAAHELASQWLQQAGETDARDIEQAFESCGSSGEPGPRR